MAVRDDRRNLSQSSLQDFKGALLERLGFGTSNNNVVAAHVDTIRCIEGITIVTSSNRDVMF